jgi:epoxyqueuosine reductase
MDDAAWATIREGSPVWRATAEGLARNAAVVLGNAGDASALPALEASAEGHPSPTVREASAWAAERLRTAHAPSRTC